MSKHTPGPWTASPMRIGPNEKDRRYGFVVNGPDDRGAPSLPIRVCDLRVPVGFEGFAEGQANAHLIAAAPDLLAALRDIVDRIDGVWDAPGLMSRGALHTKAADDIYDWARAAIARAEGGES